MNLLAYGFVDYLQRFQRGDGEGLLDRAEALFGIEIELAVKMGDADR